MLFFLTTAQVRTCFSFARQKAPAVPRPALPGEPQLQQPVLRGGAGAPGGPEVDTNSWALEVQPTGVGQNTV